MNWNWPELAGVSVAVPSNAQLANGVLISVEVTTWYVVPVIPVNEN